MESGIFSESVRVLTNECEEESASVDSFAASRLLNTEMDFRLSIDSCNDELSSKAVSEEEPRQRQKQSRQGWPRWPGLSSALSCGRTSEKRQKSKQQGCNGTIR